ncbi:MAG: glycoside hydrolase family 15 protein [Propionibacteriaceae bacterium]
MALGIEDYALLGDLHTAALVGVDGSIDWLCLPRFDSPACFAALLGDSDSGHWKVAPAAGGRCTSRRYRGHSVVLETDWTTPEGTVRVIDLMPVRGEAADVVRIVEGVSGRVSMEMSLVLRFDYGRIVPWVNSEGDGVRAVAGPDAVWLHTPVPVQGSNEATTARFSVAAGERVPFVLSHKPSHEPPPRPVDAEVALASTERFWADWISQAGDVGGPYRAAVRDSLVVLKSLTYRPTGGIAAAATTSLPEEIGGVRNWDYRFCWLRDAAFTLESLLETGYTAEARAWREWLLRAVAGDPADLQIMYGLDGTRRLTEYEVPWLPGYENSAPVRIGNAASTQWQLDVWGEVLVSLHVGRSAGLERAEHLWDLQKELLDYLEGHWNEPDNGIWEGRGARQHHVYSKGMAWAGVDRAVQAVERFGLDGPVADWRRLRQDIHDQVCDRGFDPQRGAFTQFYGSEGLDSAVLLLPQIGFLPYTDPRFVGTLSAIERELSHDGFIRRYDPAADGGADGVAGDEATFVACSFWMVDALHGVGRVADARTLYERLLALRNDVGLLSEEYDVTTGRQLGNTPQAYSHVGLVNSARTLAGSGTASKGRPTGD